MLQLADDALECGDMLLQQNIFPREILVLYANYFNHLESFNFSRGEMIVVRLKEVSFFYYRDLLLCGFLDLVAFLDSLISSRFISIFIIQASSPTLLEEGDNILL